MAGFTAAGRRSAPDEALVRSLFDEHGRALSAYANRLLGDAQAADEVVQEALVQAWRDPAGLANGRPWVRGWLLTLTRTLVDERLRARTGRPAPDRPVPEPDPKSVLAALDQLTTEHRDVLVEIFYRGSSVTKAAETLGVPPDTIRSRSYHALRALRRDVGAVRVLERAAR